MPSMHDAHRVTTLGKVSGAESPAFPPHGVLCKIGHMHHSPRLGRIYAEARLCDSVAEYFSKPR